MLLGDFWKTCPARCSLALCHGYFRPLPPPLWGSFAARFFFFYTSYLPIHLLIIILYRKIYVITVIKRVQNGILNGRKREISRKMKRKSLYFPLFKREKGKKVSKSELLTRFRYDFLEDSLIFNFFLLISYRFPILKKEKGKKKCRI